MFEMSVEGGWFGGAHHTLSPPLTPPPLQQSKLNNTNPFPSPVQYLTQHDQFLAHDEHTVCVPGDIVELHPGRTSSTKRHIVTKIISAQSTPHERRAPETYPEYLARRDAEFRAAQIRRLQGPNCEKYFKKYEKVIPDVVKVYREAWEARKKKEEEEKRREREKVVMEEREERERKKKKEEKKEAKRVLAEQRAKEQARKAEMESMTAP